VSGTSVVTSSNGDCDKFYDSLCDYYYKYDVIDGILFNNDFNTKVDTNKNITEYLQNLRFITEHIPDCKCQNSRPVKTGLINGIDPDTYYGQLKCEYENRMYGTIDPKDSIYSTKTSGNLYGGDVLPNPIKLYNLNSEKLNSFKDINGKKIDVSDKEYGFRRQVDPSFAVKTSVEMSDGRFLFAGSTGTARSASNTYNSYTCNMSYSPQLSNISGNVMNSGISMSCNFPCESGKPCASAAPATDTRLLSFTGNYYEPTLNQFISLDGSYELPIPVNNSISIDIGFPDSTYPTFFNSNYQFLLTNTVDETSRIIKYGCTNSDGLYSCTGPYVINIPFIYGPIFNNSGVLYTIALTNKSPQPSSNAKPLIIDTTLACHVIIKQYSMSLQKIRILAANGFKYVEFTINLNTLDIVNNIPYRIIFTPVDTTNLAVITMYGQDFFNDVSKSNGLLTAQYDNTQPFLNIAYNYKIMLNETVSSVNGRQIYSDGYVLLYDNKVMDSKTKDIIDFSLLKSGFNQFTLQYSDYDNDHALNMIGNNDTIKTAVNITANWEFFSDDTAYTNMNIYYISSDINAIPVKINSTPLSTNSSPFNFIFPVFPTSQIIKIYCCIVDRSGNDILDSRGKPLLQSTTFTVRSSDIGPTFRSWLVIKNLSFDTNSKFPITFNSSGRNTSSLSVTDYLSYSASNNYSNILFDYTLNKWFYTNLPLIPTSDTITSTQFVIFQALPIPPNITFTINDITYADSNNVEKSLYSIPPPTEVSMASLLNIKWQFVPASSVDLTVQVKMFNHINSSFTVPKATTNGIFQVLLYDNTGNLNIQQTDIQLVSYETLIKSNVMKISNITNTLATPHPIVNGSVLAEINTPYIFLLNTDTTPSPVIKDIKLNMNDALDNKYYIYYQNIAENTSISSYNISFKNLDVSKDISLIHSSQQSQQFSNVNIKYGLRKNYKEHFNSPESTYPIIGGANNKNMQLHIDELTMDFSTMGVNVKKYISVVSTYNGYYSINISNLVINMENIVLDDYKFNLDFNGLFTTTPTQFLITNILLIGKLTTQIMFVKSIPGLQSVKYVDKNKIVTELVYSNGYYAIPENFIPLEPVTSDTSSNNFPIWAIGLFVILLIVIIIGLWYMFGRKNK